MRELARLLLIVTVWAVAPIASAQSDPLSLAVENRDLAAVEAAIDGGAVPPPGLLAYAASGPILHEGDDRVIQREDAAVVARLLDAGADPDEPSAEADGLTPLALAVRGGRAPVVRALLDGGADANGVLASGDQPLHLVSFGGDAEAVQMLVEAGADVEAVNADGLTPLLVAASANAVAVLDALLDAGADAEVQTTDGRSALDLAMGERYTYPEYDGAASEPGWAAARYLRRAQGIVGSPAVWSEPGAPPCEALRAYVADWPGAEYGDQAVYSPAGRMAIYAIAEAPLDGEGTVREQGGMRTSWTRALRFPSLAVPAGADWRETGRRLAVELADGVVDCLGAPYTAGEPRIDEDRFQVALTFETGPAGVHGFGITLRDAAYTAEYQAYERYERPDQPALREPETLLPELFLETGQEMYFEM